MGFQQGLSGLSISSKSLDAISNNVSNAGTVGFKQSTAQFSDVFSASLSAGSSAQVGVGASVEKMAQLFNQGNVTSSNNTLDMAISGQGFFRMSNNGEITAVSSLKCNTLLKFHDFTRKYLRRGLKVEAFARSVV